MRIAVVGGDDRQCYAAHLLKEAGHELKTYGLNADGFEDAESIEAAVKDADILLLPLPASRQKGMLNAPRAGADITIQQLAEHLRGGTLLLAGLPDEDITQMCVLKKIRLVDYGSREEIAADGAVSTTEAAIALMVNSTTHTIAGSRVLVIGSGRIGSRLAQTLHAMGASVTVSARKPGDLSRIRSQGLSGIHTGEIDKGIENYDMIVNTVPALVLDSKIFEHVKKSCFVLDLASKPGGVDVDAATRYHVRFQWALGLPGKTAPEAAGRAVAETVLNILEELKEEIG